MIYAVALQGQLSIKVSRYHLQCVFVVSLGLYVPTRVGRRGGQFHQRGNAAGQTSGVRTEALRTVHEPLE